MTPSKISLTSTHEWQEKKTDRLFKKTNPLQDSVRKTESFSFFFKVQETYTIPQKFVFNKFLHNAVYVNNNIGYRPQFKTTASISKL